MKMKEICEATELTERAVRFYVQEQLVTPHAQRRGGRTWLDFSETDVERLQAIAVLRKAGFTIEEIRSMGLNFQKNAPDAAFALRRRLREAIDSYERLSSVDTVQADSLEHYAALLEKEVHGQPVPPSDQIRFCLSDCSDKIEWLCMLGMVYLFWRVYVYLVDQLFFITNILILVMPFVILPLPLALILGSKAGKWLCCHFEYIP